MSVSVLKNQNVIKTYIDFTDKSNQRIKEQIELRYDDGKFCYFISSGKCRKISLRWRHKAKLIVYTPEGLFTADTIVRVADISLSKIMYKVDIPKNWNFNQLRAGIRKRMRIPVTLNLSDDIQVKTELYDLSQSGFAIIDDVELSTVQKRFPLSCTFEIPETFDNETTIKSVELNAKYVRESKITEVNEYFQKTLYCFNFINLSTQDIFTLKEILSLTIE